MYNAVFNVHAKHTQDYIFGEQVCNASKVTVPVAGLQGECGGRM